MKLLFGMLRKGVEKRILFVCVENADRSQMAKVYIKKLAPIAVGLNSQIQYYLYHDLLNHYFDK